MQGLFALARLFLNRCCDSYSQGWIDFKKLQFTILSCRFKMFLPCVLKPNGERGGGRVDLARLRLIGRYMGIQGSSLDSPLPDLLKRNKNVFKACMAGIRKKGGGVGRIGGSGEKPSFLPPSRSLVPARKIFLYRARLPLRLVDYLSISKSWEVWLKIEQNSFSSTF